MLKLLFRILIFLLILISINFPLSLLEDICCPVYAQEWDWQFAGSPMGNSEINEIYIDPDDDNIWYVTSWNGIYITRDGGINWENHLSDYSFGFGIDPNNSSLIYCSARDKLYRSNDKGYHWTLVFTAPSNTGINSLRISSINSSVYLGLRWESSTVKNGIYKSVDKGESWDYYSFNVPESGLICWDIEEDPINGYLYIGTEIYDHPKPYNPPFLRSKDGGKTWEEISGILPWHVIAIQVHPETQKVYALTEGAGLYQSSNFGNNWEYLNNYFWIALFLDKKYPDRLFGGNHSARNSSGGVYLSEDAGKSFDFIGLSKKLVGSICMNSSGSKVFVAGYNVGIHVAEVKFPDSDNDGMSDIWEKDYFGNLSRNGTQDYDNDGLSDVLEFQNKTNPSDMDTDDDKMPDNWETQYDLNPLVNDTEEDLDNDGFSNIQEYNHGTIPNDRGSHPPRSMPWLPILLEDD